MKRVAETRQLRTWLVVFSLVFFSECLVGSASADEKNEVEVGISAGLDAYRWQDLTALQAEFEDYERMGIKWLRTDLWWSVVQADGPDSFDWEVSDRVVRLANAHGIEVLFILGRTPSWAMVTPTELSPPQHPADFARFAEAATIRYARHGVSHWEIWNEPNMALFWPPEPDPETYVTFLAAAAKAIHSADSDATVLFGGLAAAPTTDTNGAVDYMSAFSFLKRAYTAGASPHFDAMAFHPYTWPLLPSDIQPWSGWQIMNLGIRPLMIANGDSGKPIWITEFGAPSNSEGGVSEERQAKMLSEAITLARDLDWAGPVFWYSYRDLGADPENPEHFFGLTDKDGRRKSAYKELREIVHGG